MYIFIRINHKAKKKNNYRIIFYNGIMLRFIDFTFKLKNIKMRIVGIIDMYI